MSLPSDLVRSLRSTSLPRLAGSRERLRKTQASCWLIMQDFEGLEDTRIIFAEHRAQGYLQHQQAGVASSASLCRAEFSHLFSSVRLAAFIISYRPATALR